MCTRRSGNARWLVAGVLVMLVLSLCTDAAGACPVVGFNGIQVAEVTQTQAIVFAHVDPDGVATNWKFEISNEQGAGFSEIPGGSGTIAAESEPTKVSAHPIGLTAESRYFVRLVLSNSECTPAPQMGEFETVPKRPRVGFVSIDGVGSTDVQVHGVVLPDNEETTWQFDYSSTSATEAFQPAAGTGGTIGAGEADENAHEVDGTIAGLQPETRYWVRLVARNASGEADLRPATEVETAGKPSVQTFATVGVHGEGYRALGAVDAHGLPTQVHVEYVAQKDFESGGWTDAVEGEPHELPGEFKEGGFPTRLTGSDFAALAAGESYRFRMVASNEAGVVVGGEQTFLVPTVQVRGVGACTNDAFRVGLAANLADCRAYEQVTPAQKGGTMDTDTYGALVNAREVAENGETVMLKAPGTQWAENADSKNSTYVMRRTSEGWSTASITPQPEAGAFSYLPALFDSQLTFMGIQANWRTSQVEKAPSVDFKTGPPGGPYTTVFTVPSSKASEWVASSPDFSRLAFASEDRTRAGSGTGTEHGFDLYEAAGGKVRELNVFSDGKTIGKCGANAANGFEGFQERTSGTGGLGGIVKGSAHTVSSDGQRVFFEAIPGSDCSAQPHLYIRARTPGGQLETVDVGPYRFLAANAEGTKLVVEGCTAGTLVEQCNGGEFAYLIYDTAGSALKALFHTRFPVIEAVVAMDFTAFYFTTTDQLAGAPAVATGSEDLGNAPVNVYRYDIAAEKLAFEFQESPGKAGGGLSTSPDGRYYYFLATGIAGLPGGRTRSNGEPTDQAYRFDAEAGLVECVSCASGFNPEPERSATFRFGDSAQGDNVPDPMIASSDGSVMFFDTTAALVKEDVDGEIPPDTSDESHFTEFIRSPSSDTYEWRVDGFDGCNLVGGCVSLVSGGLGGYKTELIGTTPSGRDVFFATHEALVGQDGDTAGDIYDARVDGGFPGPEEPRPPCEGDACVTVPLAPQDVTPSSLLYSGPGNAEAGVKGVTTKRRCRRGHVRRHHHCVKKKRASTVRHGVASHGHGGRR